MVRSFRLLNMPPQYQPPVHILLPSDELESQPDVVVPSSSSCAADDEDASLTTDLEESQLQQQRNHEGEEVPLSRNVPLILLYTLLNFAGRSIWNQNVLPTLVYLLRDGDAKSVGFITAAMGISQLVVSVPAGILADRYRRDTLLQVAAVLGVVAIGVMGFTSFMAIRQPHDDDEGGDDDDSDNDYKWLVVALCAWGCHWGVANTSIMALFSDSILDGERSYYFTVRDVCTNVANMSGPVVALVMFFFLGDEWNVRDCSIVMLAGNIITLPAVCILFLLSDDAVIASSVDENPLQVYGGTTEDNQESALTSTSEDGHDNELEQPLLPPLLQDPSRLSTTPLTHKDETYDKQRLGNALPFLSKERIIPILVSVADITAGLASGMSIRYIAIFLYDDLDLSPVAVQVLYILQPLSQIVMRKQAQALSGTYGRCTVTVWMKWIGIFLMLSMVLAYKEDLPGWVICLLLVGRTAFMNSPAALTKSVLMDNVPTTERAKWASLESVNMFSWSGSAALGGLLVDYKGILFNFCVTAGLQVVATLPLLMLSFYGNFEEELPRTRGRNGSEASETAGDIDDDNSYETASAELEEDRERTVADHSIE